METTATPELANLTDDQLYALHSKLFSGQTKAFAVMDNLTARAPGWDSQRGLFDDISRAMRDVSAVIRSRRG